MSSEERAVCDERERGRSPWMGWTLGLVVVPVVYVLTYAPISMLVAAPWEQSPRWLHYYAKPMIWLCQHTPLEEPLSKYAHWWFEKIYGLGKAP